MAARKPQQRVRAADLPGAFSRIHGAPFDEDRHSLWWVRPAMVRIAVHATMDIPDDWDYDWPRFQEMRPAASGLLVWEGGTGLSGPRALGEPEHSIIGCAWGVRFAYDVLPLSVVDGVLAPTPHGDWGSGSDRMLYETAARLERLLITTWILADQPTVGRKSFLTSRGQETQQIDWRTVQPKPELPRSITVASLREIQRRTEPGDPIDGDDAKWHLTKRHVVRGHWRKQAAGPARKLRRPVYVPPYVKGPEGAPLRDQTPLVHIWRR